MKMKEYIVTGIALLLLVTGCNTVGRYDAPVTHDILTLDTLWTPTGNAHVDSLLQLATVAPQDTGLAQLYFDIGEAYLNTDHQQAKAYYLRSKLLSEQLGWNSGQYLFAIGFTDVLNREGLIDSSIVIHRQVLELAKAEMNELQIAKISANIGNCYNYKKWYETALQYYSDALPILEKKGEQYRLAQLYSLIGIVYRNMNMALENLQYSEKSVSLLYEKTDTLPRVNALTNYAVALLDDGQLEKAEQSLLEAVRISMLHNSEYYLIAIYNNLCDLSFRKFDWDNAELYARKAMDLASEFGAVESYCISKSGLGMVAMYRKNFSQSEEYIMEALETAVEYDMPVEKMKCYELLAELAIARHDFRTYRLHSAKADSIQTSLITEQTRLYAKEMEAKYETAKKDMEITQQQNVIARQNMQRRMFVAGITVCLVFLVLLLYTLRIRNRSNTALTERNAALDERNTALDERNNALTEINTTKDKFFNIISHDLRSPAVALNDALKLLVKNGRFWDTATLTAYYDYLLRSSENHEELITHLLNWAKAQTGRIACAPERFFLAARLRFDVSQVRDIADKKGVTLANTIPDDAFVDADADILATVVRNLLTNAVKFTTAGGIVTLSATPAGRCGDAAKIAGHGGDEAIIAGYGGDEAITAGRGGDAARHVSTTETDAAAGKYIITISDTGIGMTDEQLNNLFRLDRAQSLPGTAGEQGTGLGLIVCRDLLEKHGATLHVESSPGKGSTFRFEI